MTRYISNPENLKLMMTMLRDRSRNIQFEAFHVFKVSPILPTQVNLFIGYQTWMPFSMFSLGTKLIMKSWALTGGISECFPSTVTIGMRLGYGIIVGIQQRGTVP